MPLSKTKAVIPFGKYRGRSFDEVPTNYLNWLLGLENLSIDLRAAINHHLTDADDRRERTIEMVAHWLSVKLTHKGRPVFTPDEIMEMARVAVHAKERRQRRQ